MNRWSREGTLARRRYGVGDLLAARGRPARWAGDAVEDGEVPGTDGRSRGGLNLRLDLALAAATPASIPAMGCVRGLGLVLGVSGEVGECCGVLRMARGSLYL